MRIYLCLAALLIYVMPTFADVYQHIDAQGNVVYSDTPLDPNAKQLKVRSQNLVTEQSNIQKAPTSSTPSSSTPPAVPDASVSNPNQLPTLFTLLTPKDQETLYNQPVIAVDIKIEPKLNPGQKIQLLLDGKPQGVAQASTRLELANVERGTHQLAAVLVNDKNQILKQSNAITIYVHRTSIGNNPLRAPGL